MIKSTLTLILVTTVVIALLAIGPMLVIWSINTLAAASTASLYIEHGVWSYLAVLVLMLVIGATRTNV